MTIHNTDKIIAESQKLSPKLIKKFLQDIKKNFSNFLQTILYYKSPKDVQFCTHLSPSTYN
jgi:hypothetical protein